MVLRPPDRTPASPNLTTRRTRAAARLRIMPGLLLERAGALSSLAECRAHPARPLQMVVPHSLAMAATPNSASTRQPVRRASRISVLVAAWRRKDSLNFRVRPTQAPPSLKTGAQAHPTVMVVPPHLNRMPAQRTARSRTTVPHSPETPLRGAHFLKPARQRLATPQSPTTREPQRAPGAVLHSSRIHHS